MKGKIYLVIFYLVLPLFYLLKLTAIVLSFFGMGQCDCENYDMEKFYFQEKILGTVIFMILLTLLISQL